MNFRLNPFDHPWKHVFLGSISVRVPGSFAALRFPDFDSIRKVNSMFSCKRKPSLMVRELEKGSKPQAECVKVAAASPSNLAVQSFEVSGRSEEQTPEASSALSVFTRTSPLATSRASHMQAGRQTYRHIKLHMWTGFFNPLGSRRGHHFPSFRSPREKNQLLTYYISSFL